MRAMLNFREVNAASVFIRLRKYGLKLNVAKSSFGAPQVTYLGYVINEHGIKPG